MLISLFLLLVFSSSVYAGSVSGIVLDKSDKTPLPGVVLEIESNRRTITGSTTGEDGRFIIRNLNPGQYTLKLNIIGYTKNQKSFSIGEGDKGLVIELDPEVIEMREIVIEASRCYTYISGVISDDHQTQLNGANIIIQGRTLDGDSVTRSAESGTTGVYYLSFIEAGNYEIIATKRGWAPSPKREITLRTCDDTPTLDFRLARISGEVDEEQIVEVSGCRNGYNYILLERGDLIPSGDRSSYSDFEYPYEYLVNGARRSGRDVYRFYQPNLGESTVYLDKSTTVFLYDSRDQEKCGEQTINIKNNQCTIYNFETRNGFIPFEICPEIGITTETPSEEPILVEVNCIANKDCENANICYYGECKPENYEDFKCKDSNGPPFLVTDEGLAIENPAQKIGGSTCSYERILFDRTNTDTCLKDGYTVNYYTCKDDCDRPLQYKCLNGCITENGIGKCRVSEEIFRNGAPETLTRITETEWTDTELIDLALCGINPFELETAEPIFETTTNCVSDLSSVFPEATEFTVSESPVLAAELNNFELTFYPLIESPFTEEIVVTGCDNSGNCASGTILVTSEGSSSLRDISSSAISSITASVVDYITSFVSKNTDASPVTRCTFPVRELYKELANSRNPYYNNVRAIGIIGTGTFLDSKVGADLMKIEGYGSVVRKGQDPIQLSGIEIEGVYKTNTGKDVQKIIVPASAISGILGKSSLSSLEYYVIRTARIYYISTINGILELRAGIYLIPRDYIGKLSGSEASESKSREFEAILAAYDRNSRFDQPSGTVFLTSSQANEFLVPSISAVFPNNNLPYYFVSLKARSGNFEPGDYAVPTRKRTSPGKTGLGSIGTTWVFDRARMVIFREKINERTWEELAGLAWDRFIKRLGEGLLHPLK